MLIEKVYENEDIIIGLCFQGNIEKALNSGLTPNLFLHPLNKKIFTEMVRSYIAHKELSLNAVRLRLDKDHADRLVKLHKESAVTLNIVYFIEEAKKALYVARFIDGLRNANAITKDWKPGDSIEGIVAAGNEIPGITFEQAEGSSRTDESAVDEYMAKMVEDCDSGGIKAISTGIKEIDGSLNGGFLPGKLICIAARPGVGKTSLATNMALSAALAGYRVQYFSIELLRDEIMDKLTCKLAGLDSMVVATRKFDDEQIDRLVKSSHVQRTAKLTLETNTKSSWEYVENAIRKEHRLKQLKIAVVDYVQQFSINSKKFNSRSQEISEMTERAKSLALELKITVVLVAQLNRGAEDSNSTSPYEAKMSHLKDSGGIEQAADFIGVLHDAKEDFHLALTVLKNRFGVNGTMKLRVDLSTNKFF
ncbi:MAG: AAA family ATPase [Proteobacteria bacterium]|nr:AAA family ATPase [Pseudomonadota bacterium]